MQLKQQDEFVLTTDYPCDYNYNYFCMPIKVCPIHPLNVP